MSKANAVKPASAVNGEVSTVRLLVEKRYPAAWVFSFPPIPAGTVVPVVFASNQPQDGQGRCIRYWINTPELENDAYGIGLYDGDFEAVS